MIGIKTKKELLTIGGLVFTLFVSGFLSSSKTKFEGLLECNSNPVLETNPTYIDETTRIFGFIPVLTEREIFGYLENEKYVIKRAKGILAYNKNITTKDGKLEFMTLDFNCEFYRKESLKEIRKPSDYVREAN